MKLRPLITFVAVVGVGGALCYGATWVAKFVHRTSDVQQAESQTIRTAGVLQFQGVWYAFDERGVVGGKVDDQTANASAVHLIFSPELPQLPTQDDVALLPAAATMAMEEVVVALPKVNFTPQTIVLSAPDALWFSVTTTKNVTLLVDWRQSVQETMTNLAAALASQRYAQGGVTSIDLRFGKKVYLK